MTTSGSPAVMLVAGEASGDLHGAALCHALRELDPSCRLFGMGGARMAAEGMKILVDVTARAVTGGSEAFGQVPRLYRAYRELRTVLEGPERPAVLVLIDFPEFNLRLARAARRARVPVVYFIPPQVWAWRGGRVKTIRRFVSLVLAVFPFEAPLYRRAGVPVEFVGHPLLDELQAAPSREVARRRLGIDDRTLMVGLLPGSRHKEVVRVLPAMRDAAAEIVRSAPGTRFMLGRAPRSSETWSRNTSLAVRPSRSSTTRRTPSSARPTWRSLPPARSRSRRRCSARRWSSATVSRW